MTLPETRFKNLVDGLIAEGEALLKAPGHDGLISSVKYEDCRLWANKLVLLRALGGRMIAPWREQLSHNTTARTWDSVQEPLAALKIVRYALQEGLLTQYEDLVFAQAFADLSEQGTHLFEQGYFLAAGVIFRAVLEERLQRLCEREGCTPAKPRPTINDYNQALYAQTPPTYDKNMMLHITAIAAVGNDAAHNKLGLTSEDVRRLILGVQDLLVKFSA